MSTSSDGRANRSRSSGISEWPPASSFASSRPSSSIASSTEPARAYSKAAGITTPALAADCTALRMLW